MDRFETVYVVLDGHGAGGPDYMDVFGSEADARSYMSGLVSSGYNENELWLTETTVNFDDAQVTGDSAVSGTARVTE
jgi:hypothetical protein